MAKELERTVQQPKPERYIPLKPKAETIPQKGVQPLEIKTSKPKKTGINDMPPVPKPLEKVTTQQQIPLPPKPLKDKIYDWCVDIYRWFRMPYYVRFQLRMKDIPGWVRWGYPLMMWVWILIALASLSVFFIH